MKKISLLIFILLLSWFYSYTRTCLNDSIRLEEKNETSLKFIKTRLPKIIGNDSITVRLEECPYIFFFTGHNGTMWSLLYKDKTQIRFLNGTTCVNMIQETPFPIDTLQFLSLNRRIIQWGLDSCIIESERGILNKEGKLFPECIIVSNPDKQLFFEFSNDPYFIGKSDGELEKK